MRNSARFGAIAVAAAAATSLGALPAGAASADGAPPAVPVHHAAHHHHAAPMPPPPPPLGMIIVCNHSGYMFNVYADGPSIREDDLAGEMDECTSWDKVLTGNYQIGFGLRTTST
ncbi:MAG TPA: hypothetical protein VHV82_10925, partial [Sporichthyaceae bacterium]|nr:hypothetical protein [Sporichthyaceae bacterium]